MHYSPDFASALVIRFLHLMGGWLPASGERGGSGIAHEAYRKMDRSRPAEVETDLFVSLA